MQADEGDCGRPEPPPRPSLPSRALPSELVGLPRPRVIDISYWAWFAACLVGALTATATLRHFGELQAAVLSIVDRQFPNETPATRARVATATVATLIGAGVAIILIQIGFAIVMHRGRGWARFALALFTLLGALYAVAVFSSAPRMSQAGLVITTALWVTAAVPMFLRAPRSWFRTQGQARAAGYSSPS